jgi:hypothetical protein
MARHAHAQGHAHKEKAGHAVGHALPADVQKAVEAVAELCADCCEKKKAAAAAQAEYAQADEASTEADVRLRDAEEALVKLARDYKVEEAPQEEDPKEEAE